MLVVAKNKPSWAPYSYGEYLYSARDAQTVAVLHGLRAGPVSVGRGLDWKVTMAIEHYSDSRQLELVQEHNSNS